MTFTCSRCRKVYPNLKLFLEDTKAHWDSDDIIHYPILGITKKVPQ